MDYKRNLDATLEKIGSAAHRAGRRPDEITLLSVSKVFPAEIIRDAYNIGIRLFGESRAQELRDKVSLLPQDIKWHFIGPLQKNKIKYVVPNVELIHAVDSSELAEAISGFGKRNNIIPSILIELKTSLEEAKKGFPVETAAESVLQINELENVNVKGLMTMAPFTDDIHQIRKSFSTLKRKFDEISKYANSEMFSVLSMGMSSDFEIAIEEGSTLVRVGTGIFGPRRRKD